MRSYRCSWYDNESWKWSASSDRNADVLFTQIYMNTNTFLNRNPIIHESYYDIIQYNTSLYIA